MFRKLLARSFRLLPRWVVQPVARRYIAGTSDDDLLEAARELRQKGLEITADILGENADDASDVRQVVESYTRLMGRLRREGFEPHVSIKPTHLGLRLAESVVTEAAVEIVAEAGRLGGFVQIDMEDSSTTDATIRLFRRLREASDRVGMAIQAYLRRSLDDVESLASLRPNLRICKGIYKEPESIAFTGRDEIRENFVRLVDRTLDAGGKPSIATHDRLLVGRLLDRVRELGPGTHEFQMLAGVGHGLRRSILDVGSTIRIYVPYGPQWLDYSLRRLQENPRLLAYVVRGLLTGKAFFARR